MNRPGGSVAVVVLGMALAAVGCGKQPSEPPRPAPRPAAASKIEVMVPCGQVGPFSEIVKLFKEANPGTDVQWVPENMVPIMQQILDGKAKPDLYLTMGDLEMDRVEKAGLIAEGTRTKYAENSLAILVPKGNPAGVQTIADLTKPAVKSISIPDPETNSVGKHAVEALKQAGIWDKVQSKIFIMSQAADSKDATAKQQVQASIAYYPCSVEVHVQGQAPAKPKNLDLVGHIPADLYPSFWCEGAVIKGASNPEGGRKLLAFLGTPQAQAIFKKWYFLREVPASAAAAPERSIR